MYTETRYSRGLKDTLIQVKALLSPEVGETVFCRENGRVLTFDGDLWMCDDFIKSVNASGSTRSQGDTMIYSQGSGFTPSVVASSNTGNGLVAGVCVFSSTSGAPIAIAIKGVYKVKLVYFSTPTAIGGFIRSTSSGGGGISETTTAMSAGVYGWTLEIPSAPSSSIPTLVRCLLRGKVEYYF
jgi:hypothetical protein